MLRSGWYAQELLATFSDELDEVTLQPGTGGVFSIEANGQPIWDRKKDGGFPEITELKRRVRDAVCPERALGHIDK
ncbi:SelT/SelW/SelH family protein [Alcanivorax sp.]|uniref:SelT/SelW/SelH family protein n=1 Tax=Alcanivorax sp. TaxID=1872427 RepID=UPI000C11E000|nr:SelT/SelW/SelH family protein [Alcanivorax sp.]PHR67074.1 MAG: selenoprotein [Alcanivorax sp.]